MALPPFLRHRTAIFLLAVAATAGGWEAFLRLTAPGRIAPGLKAALQRETLLDVAVTLKFAPEDFHIRLFQGYGVVSGVQGATVLVNRIHPQDIRRIARHYWVRRITPRS